MTRTVLLAEIMHETNTFNRVVTTRGNFETRYWHEGLKQAQRLAGTNTEIGGFLEAASMHAWALDVPLAASASPSGPMDGSTWRQVRQKILAPLRAGKAYDAVVLVLHGSMVTVDTLDAEGDLLSEVRALAGPEILLAVTLDMHANVSPAMVANANLMMAYRTYPHVDQRERALHMARLVQDCLDRDVMPKLFHSRRAMMDAADHGQTGAGGPMDDLLGKAGELERRADIMCASIQIGFPWSDVPDVGPSVVVSAIDAAEGQRAADDLMRAVWRSRHETQLSFTSPTEAMVHARQGRPGGGPLVLADFADNPAGGAYGDSPNLLAAMLEAKLENAAFATISDPGSVALAHAAGEGRRVTLALGGRGAPELTPPLDVSGDVMHVGGGVFECAGPMWEGVEFSMGKVAVIRAGGIDVVISSVPTAVMDLNVFRSVGIEPRQCTTIGLKSRNHFKAAFGPIARQTMLVDAGGIASMRLKDLTFYNIPRPIWPLDF